MTAVPMDLPALLPGLHRVTAEEILARTGALLPAARALGPAPFVVTCFGAPLERVAATRAVLLAGSDAEP